MKMFFVYVCAVLFCVSFIASAASPQELYISPNGDMVMTGAKVIRIHALNLIAVTIWGQKWMVSIEYHTKLQSSDGTEIKAEQIKVGDLLEIKGTPDTSSQNGLLVASLVRDLSVGGGLNSSSILNVICPAVPVSQVVPPAVPRSLSYTLYLGSRGPEVLLLQQFLQAKGFGIPSDGVTGYFGKITEQAVKDFQQKNALETAGIVGAKTRAIINSLLGK
ncbi:MAG: peptidoglycan-binding domain-containing protein [bacterium]|nr:peptidoglycan-binding domain-containing protein [bacterium]MDZ4285300.1 peptidoglycan-binding domain-containing protein [Candidatus Sungbacteria bacterium]